MAMIEAKNTDDKATVRLLTKDSRISVWPKKLLKWPSVSAPVSLTKAV